MFEDLEEDSDNFDMHTPLMHAVINGHKEMVEKLIREQCDLEVQDINGMTALSIVIDGGYSPCHDMVKLLVDAGANLHTQDSDGLTPFMLAAKYGDEKIADILLASGDDFSPEASEALYHGARGNTEGETYISPAFIDKLVMLGADVNWQSPKAGYKSKKGSTILMELVRNEAAEQILHLLEKHPVDLSITDAAGDDCMAFANSIGRENMSALINGFFEQQTLNQFIVSPTSSSTVSF